MSDLSRAITDYLREHEATLAGSPALAELAGAFAVHVEREHGEDCRECLRLGTVLRGKIIEREASLARDAWIARHPEDQAAADAIHAEVRRLSGGARAATWVVDPVTSGWS